ncbi:MULTISPECIES: methyl-accepting chemotaxis protein [unclassified Achromobacter]|uniref:methyl-accepting chemotaxis protein n=1 Tax=unclassified Achromobacter TaxID=2626865 RepID=UPI000B518BAE|nr:MULTISPECIES: methyl-accepting chemotaxis protein [unclassified Achromobacter]OWT68123.1 hypothetical protein CEY05_29275 [Achromobacter sp. HZ34]OWT69960.1 hypothetical protein CEY04_28105 [Achromobacter sp. HZ28]
MHISNLKIGTRLALGFAIVLALLVAASLFGMYELRAIAKANRDTLEIPLSKERLAADWSRNTFGSIRRTSALAKSSDNSLAAYFAKDIEQTTKSSTEVIKQIEPLLDNEEEKQLFATIGQVRKRYTDSRNAVMQQKAAGNLVEAERLFNQEYGPSAQQYEDSLQTFVALQRREIDAAKDAIDQTYQRSTQLLIAMAVMGVLAGAACAVFTSRGIVRPISYAVRVADTVAGGDLTQDIQVRSKDETGHLLAALRTMNTKLAQTVAGIRSGSETISSASSQIAAGNADLSSRTEEQAASLEETAASMEEMASTVKQNADNARQANQMAAKASEVAERGGVAVAEVVQTMNAISASSRKISEIVSVIDGIAFQTNILALNAAVEAARAGDQGKGFAVVAGEVRTLAQRSASAAKEIKSLIEDSTGKVHLGAGQVERAGATMQEIVDSVKRVTGIMGEITMASDEQSRGVDQVNIAISQMDEVTQQNAALVEQSAAAAGAMQDQAAELVRAVAAFRIGGTQSMSVTMIDTRPGMLSLAA